MGGLFKAPKPPRLPPTPQASAAELAAQEEAEAESYLPAPPRQRKPLRVTLLGDTVDDDKIRSERYRRR